MKDLRLNEHFTKQTLFNAGICILLIILIVYSVVVRIQMYMLGTSLWIDEAFIAESIVDRTLPELLATPLAYGQTAPALYMIAVKLISLAFGASESVLRVFSFATLIGMLAAQGIFMRKVLGIRMIFTLFAIAVSATFGHYMHYSAELKPYMGDAFFVLCIFLGYYAYRSGLVCKGIRNAGFLVLIFIVCMLFSTPSVFAAAAVLIVEFLIGCIRKNKTRILFIALTGVIFLVIFALYYTIWLAPVANTSSMIEYWSDRKIDFRIYNIEAIRQNIAVIQVLLEPLWNGIWLTLPFAVIGFIISLARRNPYTLAIAVFFALLLFASSIDKYPIQPRLWTFFYTIVFIYVFVFINAVRTSAQGRGKLIQLVVPVILSAALLIPNLSFTAYGKGEDWTIWPGSSVNPLIAYAKENIKDGETLYCQNLANVIIRYKNGYHTESIGNVSADNILHGTKDLEADAELIAGAAKNGSVYILQYHETIEPLLELLREHGDVALIMEINRTGLYRFSLNERDGSI